MAAFQWDVIAEDSEGPGPRSRHGLAFDREGGATVLFGGIVWKQGPKRSNIRRLADAFFHSNVWAWDDASVHSDTWELRAGGWHKMKHRRSPPPRQRTAMVYDSRRGCCVLFGGQGSDGDVLADTWFYANRRWRRPRRRWFAPFPAPRCGHSLAFNDEEGLVVLFGGISDAGESLGDTWVFDGSRWRRVSGSGPPARRYAAFAYDPLLRGCVLHGGAEDDEGVRQFGDAWLFQDNCWTRLPETFDTDDRDDHGLAYHHTASKLVMLDGLRGARGLLVRESDGWRAANLTPLHPRLQCAPLAWDTTLNGLVLYGGEAGQGGPQMDATLVLRLSS
jgi:hypothetical protein